MVRRVVGVAGGILDTARTHLIDLPVQIGIERSEGGVVTHELGAGTRPCPSGWEIAAKAL